MDTERTPDRIHLRDHLLEVEVGAFAGERGRTQRLMFSLEADLAQPAAATGDDVDRVLSYDLLVGAVAGALAARRFDTLEALAEDVAARVLAQPVAAVRVTVEKLDLVPGRLGFSLERRAGELAAAKAQGAAPAVVRASEAMPDRAAVIVPDAPGLPLPETGDPAQLRLLALDQGAWALAARLGLPVADSRTEIEAAAAKGRAVVWAPARMVRAAADDPEPDPERLAAWLRGCLSGN
ncbi:dihydroneopterin aldolase [Paracoccus sp. S-4012]|uniref:dihydroneopterin aldolase n=1 Tax=Paracoccus sp. S-4012 TaxID=2665648 RepID=UPI0012B05CB0|nr:dihydroneopterin aldolase [Paracoccus sp. S-4012]MRX51857.1 dihydroneopterin aldolase [Paracoccus sp. S-4012]